MQIANGNATILEDLLQSFLAIFTPTIKPVNMWLNLLKLKAVKVRLINIPDGKIHNVRLMFKMK